jgi:hypothetical protein
MPRVAIRTITYDKLLDDNLNQVGVSVTVSWVAQKLDYNAQPCGIEPIKTHSYSKDQVDLFAADCAAFGTPDAERDLILSSVGWR